MSEYARHDQLSGDASIDDASLASRIAGGDRRAFELLMRRYNRRLYRLARSIMRDDTEAEDALQEAYLRAYRSIATFRGESTLATWLSRMVLNECFARQRKHRRRENVIPMIPGNDMDTTASDADAFPDRIQQRAEMRAILERKLDELPEDFRVAFVLRTVEEMSVEETAAALEIPEATVRSRHFRARSLLRESLARELDIAERDLFDFGGEHCDRIVAAVYAKLGP
jgi:RNA polymerase sigma factor (sigma-70 family)